MEANFSACLRHVLAMEGGFSNDPSDHGGATNWGVTVVLREWLVKISARIVCHGRSTIFQMAEVMVSRGLFQHILDAIGALRVLQSARC